METGSVYKWKIENLSHWCAEVHGKCIKRPASPNYAPYCSAMELYPKGISGQREHLVMRLCGISYDFSGDLSFYSSDESLLFRWYVAEYCDENGLIDLYPGPKFEDVLSRIRESGDFITVSWRMKNSRSYEQHTRTTINVFKIPLKIKPSWIEELKLDETKDICYINFTPNNLLDRLVLTCSKNDIVHFTITPPTNFEYPFSVEMCLSLTEGTGDSCVKKEHVFRDDTPWKFPDSLQKKELDGKGISLLLFLKTKHLIQRHSYTNYDYKNISIEMNNTPCFSEKAPSPDPVTSNKVAVLTKDSASQTSPTSDMPDDSVLVLSKELMSLYQDQDFSDVTLKCNNVSLPVHRAILSARSPVFKTMLSTNMRETASGEVDIGDLDPSTLVLFLTYIYTGAVEEELQCDRVLKLYYASDKYQVPSLKKECAEFLCANVSISNVCDILSLADIHRDKELTAASHDFILDNYNDVLKSKEWDTLKKNDPLLAVNTVTQFAVEDRVVRKHEPQ